MVTLPLTLQEHKHPYLCLCVSGYFGGRAVTGSVAPLLMADGSTGVDVSELHSDLGRDVCWPPSDLGRVPSDCTNISLKQNSHHIPLLPKLENEKTM